MYSLLFKLEYISFQFQQNLKRIYFYDYYDDFDDYDDYDQHGGGGAGGDYDDSVGDDGGCGVVVLGAADGDSGGGEDEDN